MVELGDRVEAELKPYDRKWVWQDSMPFRLFQEIEGGTGGQAVEAEEFRNLWFNFVEWNTDEIGIITSGVAYVYTKEVFGNKASYKTGLHPSATHEQN